VGSGRPAADLPSLLHTHKVRASVSLVAAAVTLLGVFAAGVLVGRAFQNPTPPTTGLPAFPGAMGFGAATPGGRGGRVLSVTNLQDSGPGSLRAALEATGPRTVVFRVAGTITLKSRLLVDNPYLTIAGQSAPGEGVTLRIAPDVPEQVLKIETHDVVIRYLRLRPGPDADNGEDALTIDGGEAHDIIVDHCSFSWAVDEVVNTYTESRNITIQNSIISEALSHANHEKGEHSKGLLAGGRGSEDVSILRNLFVSNVDRNPQVSGVSVADVRNNVVYNYGEGAGLGVTLVSSSKGEPAVNWVGNVYKPGPDSDRERAEFATYDGDTGATHGFYAADNKRWTPSGLLEARVSADAVGRRDTPFTVPMTPTMAAEAAYRHVLAEAGASRNRDSVDERLVQEARSGTGSIIDHPDEVGGWPTLDAGRTYADPDDDGMPSAWERSHGLDPHTPNASGDEDGDGWTNIEEFLDSRARPQASPTS
jgi:pectate lyase